MSNLSAELTPLGYVSAPSLVNTAPTKRRYWPYLIALLTTSLTVLASYWIFTNGSSRSASPPPAKPAAPRAVATAAPVKVVVSLDERSTACITEYFPEDTFEPGTDLSFVCHDTDLRKSASHLYELAEVKHDRAKETAEATRIEQLKARLAAQKALIRGENVVVPPHPDATSVVAKRVRRPLGWYELPATAMIRRKCCIGAPPVTLPSTGGRCEKLEDSVREFADASERAGDLSPNAKEFKRAVQCLLESGVRVPYSYWQPPDAASGASFQLLLSDAAVVDVQRRSKRLH